MIKWIIANKEWIFSGGGIFFVAGLFGLWKKYQVSSTNRATQPISIANQNIVNVQTTNLDNHINTSQDENTLKAKTHILFIDDDAKFKVVDILKKSGWIHTRRISDVSSIDDEKIQKANILYIDIHGVGRKLTFHDEGLGLAKAIKEKYPGKKVVIYSAQTQGERFLDAFRKADDFLAKNADPYEFQQVTERLASEILSEP
jgi:ActR/RegA family two-component response regulator